MEEAQSGGQRRWGRGEAEVSSDGVEGKHWRSGVKQRRSGGEVAAVEVSSGGRGGGQRRSDGRVEAGVRGDTGQVQVKQRKAAGKQG